MPCYATGSEAGDAQEYGREAGLQVTQLTRILCAAFLIAESSGATNVIDESGGRAWWEHHKRIDEERINRERMELERLKARNEVIERLSERDRELLGLHK